MKIDIEEGAARRFAAFCIDNEVSKVRVIADQATFRALGAAVEDELTRAGVVVRSTILGYPDLAPDAKSVFKLLADDDPAERLYAAVGSGTITDIVRFVCHRTGREFVSLPTAPSVDAYSSVVAPMLIDGVKRSVNARAPIAIFADPAVLAAAPRPMIASGFGDMLAKLTADADWKLGALIWDEVYDAEIAARSIAAARSCVDVAKSIGAAEKTGIRTLIEALIESGTCMALAGNSRPASGAEHLYAHFWEMKLYREGRPPILHGLKAGFGTIEAARLWEEVRTLEPGEAERRLRSWTPPSRSEEEARIRQSFGPEAEDIILAHERFLSMSHEELDRITRKITANWFEIRAIAKAVPGTDDIRALLALAGNPTEAAALGLSDEEVASAYRDAHYLRDRFTIAKLARMLGLYD
jgi:glycerol-1-phosphate dehydrogenase [NAD(P)+]